jgi:hypothetical protein
MSAWSLETIPLESLSLNEKVSLIPFVPSFDILIV